MSQIRLYTKNPLSLSNSIELLKENVHYLSNVMRKKVGYQLVLFNGRDGEWLGDIEFLDKKSGQVRLLKQLRPQKAEPDIWLCFALVKNAPINNLVEKATELGVGVLQPVITQHTITSKVNTERLLANAIEAAEQSERITIPKVNEPLKLEALLEKWDATRKLILCDESGAGQPIDKALRALGKSPCAIIIGPEGGFSQTEFEIMQNKPYIVRVGMGPRILRADTAAIAALTCYQSILGDWDEPPHFGRDK
jgi:16S rRNA (uracil1498-N3)-methyltransferase